MASNTIALDIFGYPFRAFAEDNRDFFNPESFFKGAVMQLNLKRVPVRFNPAQIQWLPIHVDENI